MSVLLCGDIGPDAIEGLVSTHPDLESDVLKIPHHGARESSSAELISASRPSVATISAGAGNGFGHPSKRCIDLLEARGVTVARTDRQGDIEISVHSDRIGLVTDRR
jgi:competence protein ComEC